MCTIAPPPIRQDDPFPGYGHATRRHTAYSGSMMGFGNSTENCVGIRRPFVSKRAIHRRAHAQCIHVKTYVPVVTTYRVGVNRKGAAQQPHELVRYPPRVQTKHRQIEIQTVPRRICQPICHPHLYSTKGAQGRGTYIRRAFSICMLELWGPDVQRLLLARTNVSCLDSPIRRRSTTSSRSS